MVQQISSGETKYGIGLFDYKTDLVYNDNLLEPRIKETKFHYDSNNHDPDSDNSNNWKELNNFNFKYEYNDILGRITKKEKIIDLSENPNKKIKTELSYLNKETNQIIDEITNIKHNLSSIEFRSESYEKGPYSNLEYSYTYNDTGNLINIDEKVTYDYINKTLGPENVIANDASTRLFNKTNLINYSYDGLNRLATESNRNLNINNTYSYVDDKGKDRNRVTGVARVIWDGVTYKEVAYKEFEMDNFNRLINYKENNNNKKSYTYNNNLNPTKIIINDTTYNLKWERDNLLSEYGNKYEYKYNYQGVRYYKKYSVSDTITYYYDGSKLLGEDYSNNYKLRYIYDLTGISGVRVIYGESINDYTYVRDGQGNVVAITLNGKILVYYEYDAWGNCSETKIDDSHVIVQLNALKWRGHYYDKETSLYYINGRYYDPEVGQYLDSQDIENIIEVSTAINGLNMYTIATDNPNTAIVNSDNILTTVDYSPDPTYHDGMTWWQRHWRQFIKYTLFALTLTASIVLMLIPGTRAFGVGMFVAGMKAAATGAIISGLIGGLLSFEKGNSFIDGATKGAIQGAISGFTAGALLFCASSAISAIVNKIKASNIKTPKPNTKCFIAGTLVLTESGHKAIEDIEIGDKVWAYDEETGEQQLKEVITLFRNSTLAWSNTYIDVDGVIEKITSTPGHKYYLPNNTKKRNINEKYEHESYADLSEQWVSAQDLKIGDKVLLSNGKYGIIIKTEIEKLEESETTYNFEVADYHTYYVGNNSVCVHNTNCGGYKVDETAMKPHTDGTLGKSQFLPGTDANKIVMDAARTADVNGLWTAGNQAKVLVPNGPIGTVPTLHQGNVLTDIVKVTRKANGLIHGWPAL